MSYRYSQAAYQNPYDYPDDFQDVPVEPEAGTRTSARLPPPPTSIKPSAPSVEDNSSEFESPEQQPTYQPTIELVRRQFEVRMVGVARLMMYENEKPLYSIKIDAVNFKLEIRDGDDRIASYVKANLLPIRDTYQIKLPSGIQVGEYTKRIKINFSGARKYHYINKVSDEKYKVIGNMKNGVFEVTKGDDGRIGSWNFIQDGAYSATIDRCPADEVNTLHIACLLIIGMIDHMASRS
jgi:uncharacterized protein YxjI